MEPKDIEQLLKNAKFKHLSEETLVSYRDSHLEGIGLAVAEAHLKLCVICEQRLDFLKEEAEALESYELTDEDRTSIRETIRKLEPQIKPTASMLTEIQRLTSYIRDVLNAWMLSFATEATLGSEGGDEIWRYESEDGLLTAWARLNREDGSLTVHFSSPNRAWEGARLRFRLGPFIEEVILQHEEGSKVVVAEIRIPLEERASDMADISIEVVNTSQSNPH